MPRKGEGPIQAPRLVLPMFLLIAFAGAMVLGPFLNLALHPFGVPFHRVMSRALLISALGALLVFRRELRLRSWWPTAGAVPQIQRGLFLAGCSSLGMIVLYFALGGFHSAHLPAGRIAVSVVTALVAALIVPMLEETIFRGFLITVLAQAWGRGWAWVAAALIYTVAHFLRFSSEASQASTGVFSGAHAVGTAFLHLGDGELLGGRGLNLLLVGLILGRIFLVETTLWVNGALHGGWILILMTFSALTRPDVPPRFSWAGDDLLSSPCATAVLALLGVFLLPSRRPANQAP